MSERCMKCKKFKSKQGCKYCEKHGGSLKSTITNIKKHGLTAFNSTKKRYNYLGPFNSLDNGTPINALDTAAKYQDEAYDRLGKQAYFKFSNADQRLIDKAKQETGNNARITENIFTAKKKINDFLGVKPLYDAETDKLGGRIRRKKNFRLKK